LGEIVFMNYNIDYPTERGILVWCFGKKKIKTKNHRAVIGDISDIYDKVLFGNCLLIHVDDIFKINNNMLFRERSAEYAQIMQSKHETRVGPLICIDC
jgi:E3 ubiquitin-protein ligase UHRF1